MIKSLNQLCRLRHIAVRTKIWWLRKFWRMDVHPTVEMSLSAKLDKTYPAGVHVGSYSYIAFDTRVLTHDTTRNLRLDTRIGQYCFIGGKSLILPGVQIGDHCIVGAGSVVTKSVPSGCIVAGNPAKVIRQNMTLLPHGRIPPLTYSFHSEKSGYQLAAE
jgi:serine acetyltransferase